ncbi:MULTISPECIES: hypothetical protein [unclassified Nonomuraea]|uniref:hypothetical protein n=1 Tax=unclassified Nonomuraea TaxID=2593643 RepID=UPI0033C69355
MTIPNVLILMTRCSRDSHSAFGIRMEEHPGRRWLATWAFTVNPGMAQREGYDRTRAEGSFEMADDYPGCLACGAGSVVLCSMCDKLGCWDTVTYQFHCPWCGASGRIEGTITQLRAAGDV